MQTIGEIIEILGENFKVVSIKENGEVILEKAKKNEKPARKKVQRKGSKRSEYT